MQDKPLDTNTNLLQILDKPRAMKISQGDAQKRIEQQFCQIHINVQKLSARMSSIEQWVSDLEGTGPRQGALSSVFRLNLQIFSLKLMTLKISLTALIQDLWGSLRALRPLISLIKDLICQYVYPEAAAKNLDLTIMRAHRVPTNQCTNDKYPLTILVNFGAICIKEQILANAIWDKVYKTSDNTSFRTACSLVP
ncbi:hypothetical protein NDU88_007539 [Pleurodeles waltl]|uniref:Uncharacterized protein n=1 Tax=Pleurodeles waltl TaxID=8319 RepID=A0AAV7N4J9_PLEWA|nr:hypothetical protein NDU88_007539 [Pleurodeles waltl]